jgi:hypothetical protein
MKRFSLLVLATIALAVVGCEKSNNYLVETDAKLINASFYNNSYSVSVTSEHNWEAVAHNEWITLTKATGVAGVSKLEFFVIQNPEIVNRKGTIEIRANGSNESKTITISQMANDFAFAIENLTSKSVDLRVTAKSDARTFYWYTITDQDFSDYYERNTVALMKGTHAMINQYINMGAFPSWSALISTGSSTLSAKGLRSDTEYMMFAFGVDAQGNITSEDISYIWFRTKAEE